MTLAPIDALENYVCPEGKLITLLPNGGWIKLYQGLRYKKESLKHIMSVSELPISLIDEYSRLLPRERNMLPGIGPRTREILNQILIYKEQEEILFAPGR